MLDVGIQLKLDANKALVDAEELYERLLRAQTIANNIKLGGGNADAGAAGIQRQIAVLTRYIQLLAACGVGSRDLGNATAILTSVMTGNAQAISSQISALTRLLQAQKQNTQQVQQQAGFATGLRGEIMSLVGSYISLAGAMRIGRDIIESRIEMDRLDIGMKAIAPNIETATTAEEFLIQRTNELGLSLQSTIPEFIKMNAAFTQSGLTFKQTETIFTDISTAVVALGLSSATVGRILYDFQEMASMGTVQMRQMRQVMMQIPGGMEIAARSMGVTTEKLHEMIRAGTLDPATFIPAFTHELANTFGKELPEAEDRLEAHTNRLKNAWTLLMAEMGKSPAIKYTIDAAADALKAVTPNTLDQARIEAERKKLVFGKDYDEQTGANMTPNILDIIGEGLYPQSFISDQAVQEQLNQQDRLAEQMRRKRALSSGATLYDPAAPSVDTATEQQVKQAEKFWDIYDKLREDSLRGEDKQRQEIIDRFSQQLRKLPQDIPMRQTLIDMMKSGQTQALSEFDEAEADKRNKAIGEQRKRDAESLVQNYSELLGMSDKIADDMAGDTQARQIEKVNNEYDKMLRTLQMIQAMNTARSVAGLFGFGTGEQAQIPGNLSAASIEAARQRAIENVRPQKSPWDYAGSNVNDLGNQREALKQQLLTTTDENQFRQISMEIQNISQEMSMKLQSDSVSIKDSFTLGFKETVDSWGTASQRMAKVGEETANSIASNFTNAFMSMVDGTKSPQQAFADMTRAIVADLVRILIEEMIVKQIMSAFGFGMGGAGGSAGAGDVGVGGGMAVGHSGGIVGHLPRYHSGGVLGDEMPIVARRGEGVFTPEQMKMLGGGMGKGGGTNVTIANINDPREAEKFIAANPQAIINAIGSSPGAMATLKRMLN